MQASKHSTEVQDVAMVRQHNHPAHCHTAMPGGVAP